MTPYMDFPQLLALLLRMLHEGSIEDRLPIMKVRACAERFASGAAPSPCATGAARRPPRHLSSFSSEEPVSFVGACPAA